MVGKYLILSLNKWYKQFLFFFTHIILKHYMIVNANKKGSDKV
jgi:hypothetical protein